MYDTGIEATYIHAVFAPEHLARVARWEDTYRDAPMGASRFRALLGAELASQRRGYLTGLSRDTPYQCPPTPLR